MLAMAPLSTRGVRPAILAGQRRLVLPGMARVFWRAPPPCDSERSEESTLFRRATKILRCARMTETGSAVTVLFPNLAYNVSRIHVASAVGGRRPLLYYTLR